MVSCRVFYFIYSNLLFSIQIYTGKSCSRSCTPSDWRSAVKGRKHRHTDKEKHDDHNKEDPHSRRHERPRNDHHRRRHSSSPTNDSPTRHDRRPKTSPPSSSQIRSPSPPIDDQSGIDHSQSHQKEYVNTICANPASSSSKKRRKRWENEEELNRPERTSHTFVKTEISSSSIDQQQDQTSSSYNQREELKHDRKRVNHTLAEWQVFEQVHRCQLNHYIQDSILVSLLIYKFFLGST